MQAKKRTILFKSILIILGLIFVVNILAVTIAMTSSFAAERSKPLEGFNWYNEKADTKKVKPKKLEQNQEQANAATEEELPQYEKNIRSLKKRHEQAHRRALDNPTEKNLLAELLLEKEMMRKSKTYGERRVVVSMLHSEFSNMQDHSNVLHRRVQEEIDEKEDFAKLTKLSKDWGLVVQITEDCAHCHAFAPIVLEFASKHGFQLLAASKDGQDFKGIEGVTDHGEMMAFNPSRETPILYLVKGDGSEVWPISRGIQSADQITLNLKQIDKHKRRLF